SLALLRVRFELAIATSEISGDQLVKQVDDIGLADGFRHFKLRHDSVDDLLKAFGRLDFIPDQQAHCIELEIAAGSQIKKGGPAIQLTGHDVSICNKHRSPPKTCT
ncbi:hypothetical protein LTR94_025723, partial [Friedmanniomyces endolithicus]